GNGVTFAGANTVALNSANNYAGTTTYNGGAGTLSLGNISALSNGPLVLTGRVLANSAGGHFALANPGIFNNRVITLSGANRTFSRGPIPLIGNNQFLLSNPTFCSGVVSGPGSLNLVSGNALVMQNPNNTYSGGTNVGTGAANGQLQVNTSDVFTGGVLVSG